MNYKLAKQLKDAGFPDIRIGEYFEHKAGSHSDTTGCAGDDDPCFCNKDKLPTLSELIAECGDRFYMLRLVKDYFQAVADNEYGIVGLGKTPEIAAVKLYLELKK